MINNSYRKLNTNIKMGLIFICIPITIAIIAPLLMSLNVSDVDPIMRFQFVSAGHFMGTDDLGRDIFSRVIYGIRISIFIGLVVTIISALVGMVTGILSAYYRPADLILMRLVDGIMAFPTIILAISLAGVLGAGISNIIIALSISYFPMFARITKNSVLTTQSTEYVESAIALGKHDFYIIKNYILPNILPPVIVQVTFTFAMAILNESILSFLGVGIQVPMPSLGGMVNDGRNYLTIAPWIITFPGLTISWIVMSLNLIGDGVRDQLDPKKNRK